MKFLLCFWQQVSARDFYTESNFDQMKTFLVDAINFNEMIHFKIVSDFLKLIFDPYQSA